MLIIGIAGGSGSGKSTLVERLLNSDCGSQITFLPHDAYYHHAQQMPEELRRTQNWDHPDALDNQLFVEHIERLLNGHGVRRPTYDFVTHSRCTETVTLEPRSLLLVEGILLFAIPEIRDRIQLRVYVDTPADLRMVRRLLRDTTERGRSLSSVVDQYQSTVKPMHDRFVETSKAHAHLIIPWELHNTVAADVLLASMRASCDPSRVSPREG